MRLLLIFFSCFALIPSVYAQSPPDRLPLGQVELREQTLIYASSDENGDPVRRGRAGDILPIYQIDGDWGLSDLGWLNIGELQILPMPVHYSLSSEEDLTIETGCLILIDSLTCIGEASELSADETTGLGAVWFNQGLVYGDNIVGWTGLENLVLDEPSLDLLDFVESTAYVRVEQTPIYAAESEAKQWQLGQQVDILAEFGDWLLMRSGDDWGWGIAADFDRVLRPQTRATVIVGPVNFRASPIDGRVLSGVDYLQEVLVLGRNENGDWLNLRLRLADGTTLDGWVSADFIELPDTVTLNNLPITSEEN